MTPHTFSENNLGTEWPCTMYQQLSFMSENDREEVQEIATQQPKVKQTWHGSAAVPPAVWDRC